MVESRGRVLLGNLRTWRGICAIIAVIVAAVGLAFAIAGVKWGLLLSVSGSTLGVIASPIWQGLIPPRPSADPVAPPDEPRP